MQQSPYDGQTLKLTQSKTGRPVVISVAAPLKVLLDEAKVRTNALMICTNSLGEPWTSSGFRASWRKLKAKPEGLTFHDLRGTCVTQLALSGASVPEIAGVTGHSLKDVEAMLDKHYLSRDRGLGVSAMAKREKYQAEKEGL